MSRAPSGSTRPVTPFTFTPPCRYKVESVVEPVQVHTARWIEVDDPKKLKEFRDKDDARLAHDHYGQLVYLASSSVNLSMTRERFPDVRFLETRAHGAQ